MERQAKSAVNFLAVTNVASHRQRSIAVPNSRSRRFHACGVAREHYDRSGVIRENFGDGFPNSHGCAGHNYNFSFKWHDVLALSNLCGSLIDTCRTELYRTIEQRPPPEMLWKP
jgi:hypothetical protein